MKLIHLTFLFSCLFLMTACSNNGNTKSVKPEFKTEPETTVVVNTTPRVTGIGGIFFKTEDPIAARNWYGENLGLAIDDYGSAFEFRNANQPDEINYLRWGPFKAETKYFEPSQKDFMINYRVYNIEGLVRKLKAKSVVVVDTIETYEYGKFVHILDPYGHKIELWEPVDSVFTAMGRPTTK